MHFVLCTEGEKCTALTPLQIEDLYEYVSTSHLFVPFGAPSALRARERRALTFLLVLTPSPKGTGLVKKPRALTFGEVLVREVRHLLGPFFTNP